MAEIRRPLSAVERWYWLSDQFSACLLYTSPSPRDCS